MDNLLKTQILRFFPNTKVIVLWGSAANKDFDESLGDVDVLIILNKVNVKQAQKQLQNLLENVKNQVNLDPAVISLNSLKKDFQAVAPFKTRQLHGMDRYQIKYLGKVIYGNEDVLNLIPKISICQALQDVLPYIKKIFIPKILKELESAQCSNELIHEYKDSFFVLTRTLYSLETGSVALKLKSLEYLSEKYPSFLPLFSLLKSVYRKELFQEKVEKKTVEEFVTMLEERIDNFNKDNG